MKINFNFIVSIEHVPELQLIPLQLIKNRMPRAPET